MALIKVHAYTVDLMNELGHGTFGEVYKGWNKSNDLIAIKRISKRNGTKTITEALVFYNLKKNIRHNNIIMVHDVKTYGDFMWIMMEFCNLGDLNQFFKTHSMLVQPTLVKFELMRQTISGIAFLHSKDIVHRDIKPGNILITKPHEQVLVKVGDFGLAKLLDPDSLTSAMSSNVGTNLFKAPEFWDDRLGKKVKYHSNIDVYSAGLTFVSMLQAEPDQDLVPKAEGSLTGSEANMPIGLAVNSRRAYKQPEFNVVENKPDDDNSTKAVKELIRGMTRQCPRKRLSSLEVQQDLEKIVLEHHPMTHDGHTIPEEDQSTNHGPRRNQRRQENAIQFASFFILFLIVFLCLRLPLTGLVCLSAWYGLAPLIATYYATDGFQNRS